MNIEIELSAPVIAHGEKLHILELRQPTYNEIERTGFPFTLTDDGGIKIDSGTALKYIPVLAGIPRSSAEQLAITDLFKISMTVMRFFTSSATEKISGSDSTTSPISGE